MGNSIYSFAAKSAAIMPTFVVLFHDIDPHIVQKYASANMISLDFAIANEYIEVPR